MTALTAVLTLATLTGLAHLFTPANAYEGMHTD
jgi:hypothetical protein